VSRLPPRKKADGSEGRLRSNAAASISGLWTGVAFFDFGIALTVIRRTLWTTTTLLIIIIIIILLVGGGGWYGRGRWF